MSGLESIDRILKRFVDGLYTSHDINHIFGYFRSRIDFSALNEKMDSVWAAIEENEVDTDRIKLYKQEAYQLLRKNSQPKRNIFYPYLKYVAILLLFISVGGGVFIWDHADRIRNQTYTEVKVERGKHKRVLLPDGTKVIMNAGSYLKYPVRFVADIRQVEMEGEAFFEVVKDENKPFIVKTEDAAIKVLGTSFNVKAYRMDEQLTVSVRTGKVQVDLSDAMIRLLPDEQIVLYKRDGEIQKRNELAKNTMAWITYGLYFNRTPIRSVIQELERVYDCKIEFTPGYEYNDYIYGAHDNKSLISVLNSIQYSTGIKYSKEGDKIILYK